MSLLKVAFRQLYVSRGCGLSVSDEFNYSFDVDGFKVDIYLGKEPRLNLATQSKEIIFFDPNEGRSLPTTLGFGPVRDTRYNGNFFSDFFCTKDVEIEPDIFEKISNPITEAEGRAQAINFVRTKYGESFECATNFAAGILGLRIHAQFVSELINEFYWIWNEEQQIWNIEPISSQPIRFLESVRLNENGCSILKETQLKTDSKVENILESSVALALLKRGWQEQNVIHRFVNFFTALEVAIRSVVENDDSETEKEYEKLRAAIAQVEVQTLKADLYRLIDKFSVKKSMVKMFVEIAEAAKFETKENDIAAFKAFYKARNKLYHGGIVSGISSYSVDEENLIHLEHLAEQYINWIIFRDDNCYKTRFQKRARIQSDKPLP